MAKESLKQQPVSLKVLDGQTELVEEDLQQAIDFFNRWGRELFITGLLAFALIYGYNVYTSTQLNAQKAGADRLHNVRTAYQELLELTRNEASEKESIEKAKSRLNETIKTLGDAKSPYKEFVPLYKVLAAGAAGDKELSKTRYEELAPNFTAIFASSKDFQKIDEEPLLLAVAKQLVDNDSMKEKGYLLMKDIAQKGSIASAAALHSLEILKIDLPKDLQDQLPAIRANLLERHPEYIDVLK